MTEFASKPSLSPDKLRGGYYTPGAIARFVSNWASAAGPRRLEPACGDGGILRHLSAYGRNDTIGIELLPEEAEKARRASTAEVVTSDFFTWFTPTMHGQFDAVAGNPPYIRFGSWAEEHREPAFMFMASQNLKPSRLTNSFVPFVVASVKAVRPGGRVALVLPAELLQVGYASQLRRYLVDNCTEITVVGFKRLLFAGVLQEVVVMLAKPGKGPALIRTFEVGSVEELEGLDLEGKSAVRAPLHDNEKWTKYFLGPEAIHILRTLRADSRLIPLGELASVEVGVVSGRNSFFCMSSAEARARGLWEWTVPIVSKSQQVPGLKYGASDLEEFELSERNTRLLHFDLNVDPNAFPALAAYLKEGEDAGVPTGYKCRIRSPWWKLPKPWTPAAFMLRQIGTHPRIIVNETQATSTDTVHRVRLLDPEIDPARLSVGAFNSATFALSEVIGRSYGGGILELEPSEARELPVINPKDVPSWIAPEIDELVRAGRIEDALDIVDEAVLVRILGFDRDEVSVLRQQWVRLRDRRMNRGKRLSSPPPDPSLA